MYTQFASRLTGEVMGDHIVRDQDGKIIVAGSGPDWNAYVRWLAAGNMPTPAPAWTPARSVDRRRLLYALNQLGVRAAWDTALAAQTQNVRDYFASADPIPEANPKVARVCARMVPPQDVTALFDLALTL